MLTPVKFRAGAGARGLVIDSTQAVGEINENNNKLGVRVTVTGSCMP